MAFDVFISHSTRNKLIADAMKQYLQSKGIRCWKAPDDIIHGESWAAAIPRAIKNSQIMVLIWTVDSMNSRQVVNELTLADRAKKLIIPFRTEPIEPENEFEYYLAKTHWFDAFGSNNDDDFELLSERIMRNLDESARPSAQESVSSGIGYSLASFQEKQAVRPLEPTAPLIGSTLLAKVKELGDAGKSELVRACGYVSTRKDGGELLNFQAFYEALLDAKGVQLAPPEQEISSDEQNDEEKELDYRLTTAPDGSLLYTSSYTCPHDLLPGDEFDVILGTASIVLAPCGWEEDEELADELSALGTNRTWLVTVDSQNNIRIPTEALSALGAHPGQQFMVRLRRKLIKLEVIAKGASNYGISDLTTTENYFNSSEASWTENTVGQVHLDTSGSPLQGDELIAKVKELGDASKADLVRSCGYATSIRSGGEYLNFAAFFEALLEAKGAGRKIDAEEAEVINLHEAARARIDEGDSGTAVQLLDRAISKASAANILDGDLYYDRSLALSNTYRNADALVDLTLAIEMSEEPKALYYRLRGIIHEELGDLALACADWRLAAELGDTDSREWFDGQCSCRQDLVSESQLTDAISIAPQEGEGIVPAVHDSCGSELNVKDDHFLIASELTCNDSLDNVNKLIRVIVEEAEGMSGESAIKTRSYYRMNPAKRDRLLNNHCLSSESDTIVLFFNTSLIRAKNGLLITDRRISVKDFWEKPVHFDLFRGDEGLLTALIGVSVEKATVSIYRNRGDQGAHFVRELGLGLHSLARENTRLRHFLHHRIPKLIELLAKRQMIIFGPSLM